MQKQRTKKRSLRLPGVRKHINSGVGSGTMTSYQSTKSTMQSFTNRKISMRPIRPRGVEVSGLETSHSPLEMDPRAYQRSEINIE